MVEEKRFFTLHCDRSRHLCEIRWDVTSRQPVTQIHRPSKLFRRRQDAPFPQALSPAELQLLFDIIPLVSFGHNAANRNGALVRLLLWGMLRVSELVDATWEAVDGQTLAIYGKGRRYRCVPIVDQSTWTYLNTSTNELRLPLEQRFHGALFRQLDHEETPLTKHSVEHVMLALQKNRRCPLNSSFYRRSDKPPKTEEKYAKQSHKSSFPVLLLCS